MRTTSSPLHVSAARLTALPDPFAIAYRRLANAASEWLGGCEGFEGLGEGDGGGDKGLVEPGDLGERVKVECAAV